MDEDDLFAGSMEIDDPAALPANTGAVHARTPRPGVDEDMSEVAQIMLNLKVRTDVSPHTKLQTLCICILVLWVAGCDSLYTKDGTCVMVSFRVSDRQARTDCKCMLWPWLDNKS